MPCKGLIDKIDNRTLLRIPLCLPPKNFDWRDHIGQLGYLAGWEKTEEGSVSDDLNTVALNITAIDVCNDTYDPKQPNNSIKSYDV